MNEKRLRELAGLNERGDFEESLENGIGGLLGLNPTKINVRRRGANQAEATLKNVELNTVASKMKQFNKTQIQSDDGFWRISILEIKATFGKSGGTPLATVTLTLDKV